MSRFGKRRTTLASALCAGVVIVLVSSISLSLAYSPGFLSNTKKGSGIKKAVNREYVSRENSVMKFIDDKLTRTNGRRGFMKRSVAALLPLAVAAIAPATQVNAFDNRKDDKYADVIPQTGIQPKDLGHSQRSNYVGLKQCGNSPNCWNSSTPKANIPARWLPAWEANGRSIDDVKKVIDTYEVGQNDIDGGGFKIIEYSNKKSEPDNQYLYVQFQSYKAGYIDDFECWFNPVSKKFDVRSASRVGYSDLGVNALRLEYIRKEEEWKVGLDLDV